MRHGGKQQTRLEEQGHLLLKDKSGVIGVTEMWPVQEIGCNITLQIQSLRTGSSHWRKEKEL